MTAMGLVSILGSELFMLLLERRESQKLALDKPQAYTHRTVKLPGLVLSFGSQVQAISLRDLATVGQE